MTSNELDLSLKDSAKFHQILFKIATGGAMTNTETDRQTDASDLIICPMLCIVMGQIINSISFITAFYIDHFSRYCVMLEKVFA